MLGINRRDLARADFLNMLEIGKVDTGSGTLFGVPQRREVEKKRLTLVISTGGSGKNAILQAINIAKQKLEKDYSSYMKFLVIDSAKNELDPLQRMGIDTMNISSPMAQIRLSPEKRSPFYRRFINKDFPAHDLEEGYGSRLRSKVRLYDQRPDPPGQDSRLLCN